MNKANLRKQNQVMDKRAGLLIILICTLIAAGIYNFYYFSTKRNTRSTSAASKQKLVATARRMDRTPEKANQKGSLKANHFNSSLTLPEGWGRNPFLAPAETKQIHTSTNPLPVRPLPEYVVTSILISSTQKVAVIDGKIVSPGDSIGRETVKEISTEGVVLAKGAMIRTIKLRQGRTTIKARIP